MKVSKSMFQRNVSHLSCHIVNHPWNENCICANLDMLCSSTIGVNKFYNLYYLVDLFLRRKQFSKSYVIYLLKGLVRSTVFGVFVGNVFVMCNCMIYKLLGRWYYYNCMFTGTIAGLCIFFENPKRRGGTITTFMNWALELIVNQLRQSRFFKTNKKLEILFFMICSAVFMYFLRTDPTAREVGGPYVWFYTPPLFPYTRKQKEGFSNDCINRDVKVCPHEGTCCKDIIKSVCCALCRYQGSDSSLHAVLAGFLAGSAYYLEPNISILLTVVSNLLIIGGRRIRDSQNLPNWPYGELVLAFCYGLLYHYRILNPECCPAFFINMIDACTSGKSALAYKALTEAISKQYN